MLPMLLLFFGRDGLVTTLRAHKTPLVALRLHVRCYIQRLEGVKQRRKAGGSCSAGNGKALSALHGSKTYPKFKTASLRACNIAVEGVKVGLKGTK